MDKPMTQVVLDVRGMSCTGCEERIGKVLGRLEGVHHTGADHRTGQVRVTFNADQVQPQVLAERIEQAGYQVTTSEEGS